MLRLHENAYEKRFHFLATELQAGEANVYKLSDQDKRLIIPFFWVLTATCLKSRPRNNLHRSAKAIAETINCRGRL